MQITKADYSIAWLTLLSGLTISGVAVYYSVAGLMSIFAAAAIPIMVMGIFLETSKLVATVWLKRYWGVAPLPIRIYLSIAVLILMLITSMGIYGFLAKAHLTNTASSGDVVAKVAIIDEKLRTQQENILLARKTLTQLDAAVDQTMERSTSAQGATNAVYIRRAQNKERNLLQNEISIAQDNISKLTTEKEPYAKEIRVVEAEVGPLKYIAALLYGDVIDSNLLERAVRWVIILIVVVFDPLAVVLLLTSQYTFQYIAENKTKKCEDKAIEEFVAAQRPLEPEFQEVLNDNLESLYEVDDIKPVVPETRTVNFHEFVSVPIEPETKVEDKVDFQEFMSSVNALTLEINDTINTTESVGSSVALTGIPALPQEDDFLPDTMVEEIEQEVFEQGPIDISVVEEIVVPMEEIEAINTDSAVSSWSVEPKKKRGFHSNRGMRIR